ncbi:MAG: ATP-binding cassette domain-containing protein [Sphaerochaetaceae bacterium]
MSKLELSHIGKIYDGGVRAVDDFNLTVEDGEFIVLVGPSGCGKSTMLRMVAGLESITEGTFSIDGKVVNNLPPVERDISLVFQNYALYGNMSVYDNVGMSLKVRHRPKVEIYEHVINTSKFLGIEEFLNRYPNQLSGGQKQRVALGRSIARNPQLFLMDEPLSNLDAKLRAFTRGEIVRIQKKLGITTIYVTHDQVEAMTMADRIVIMKNGMLQQFGTPTEVYNFPCNEFVASFIGMPPMTIISGKIQNRFFVWDNLRLKLNSNLYERVKNYEGKEIKLGFRAENISIEDGDNSLKAKVRFKEYLGGSYSLFLMLGTNKITATVDDEIDVDKEFLNIKIDQSKIHFFNAETRERIK